MTPAGHSLLAPPASLPWCLKERLRLQGEEKEVNDQVFWEVHDFNQNLQKFKSRCAGRVFRPQQGDENFDAFTPLAQQGIRKAGAVRFAYGRIGRASRQVYIAARTTRVFETSERNAVQVAKLTQWDEAFRLGESKEGFAEIEWQAFDKPARRSGWVNELDIASGIGSEVRMNYCRAVKGPPIAANEIVKGSLTRDLVNLLRVQNQAILDIYVKLLHPDDEVAISFLVPAETTRTIKGIPNGDYNVVFGTGTGFSRGCAAFIIRGHSGHLEHTLIYDDRTFQWDISLKAPLSKSSDLDTKLYNAFDAL